MSESRTSSRLLGTPPPRWSRGMKVAMACWASFIALFFAGLIFLIVRAGDPDDRTLVTPTPVTRPVTDDGPAAAGNTQPPRTALLLPGFEFAPSNVQFTSPLPPAALPNVEILTVPEFPGYSAIWGATGRDHRGHVWLGVSTRGYGEAHLVEFNPHTNELTDHGSVRDQLKRLDLWEKGMSQIKIHSRILQAPDGYLYFTSMDEKGESATANPINGSYLWRIHPLRPAHWERLAHAPQGLIALACGGPMIYMLGYHDHVLHQYDTRTGNHRTVTVGSTGGHISRNFIVDHRDHAYVPRVRSSADGTITATLVEFDANLAQLNETALEHYITRSPAESHGIIAVQPLADQSIIFTTHGGMLHQITPLPAGDGSATVQALRFIHPQGSRYIPSLFTCDGKNALYAVSFTGSGFDWLRFDLVTQTSTVTPLSIEHADHRPLNKHLIYGSMTRDAIGAFVVAGTDQNRDRPVIWRLVP